MKAGSILVTGGAGFIGSHFVRQMVKNNQYEKIFVLDSLTYAADLDRINDFINQSKIEFIHCDVNDTEQYSTILTEVNHVVHFAAESHVDRSNADGVPFLKSNVLGTYRLLEATRSWAKIRTLLVSTDEVYGSIEDGESDESSQLNPSSAYSASKTSSDLFGLAMFHTFNQDVLVSRGCNTYGPYQHVEKLIPLCISKLLLGHKAPLYGDGLNVREWIHVSDHTSAIDEILKSGKSGNVYNIGSGMRFTNREIVDFILLQLNLNQDSIVHVIDRPGHDRRYALDSSKIKKELKWKPQVDFEAGLMDTIDWYREKLGVS